MTGRNPTGVVGVFGYGSLVNPDARPAGLRAAEATITGWTREWKHCVRVGSKQTCVLTISPSEGQVVAGVVLATSADDVANFDEREVSYDRISLPIQLADGSTRSAWTYVGDAEHHAPATRQCPIWRSYVDCVLAGFLRLGGPAAVDAFIDSTTGWEGPLLDDRAAPNYPRAIRLEPAQQRSIDDALDRSGALKSLFR